jgi:outer membrane protein assembly factor BamB
VANGVVYVGSYDGNVYAFDQTGGAVASTRPDLTTLRPNLALKPSQPVTKLLSSDSD